MQAVESLLVYLAPPTSVLGAVPLTGYLGGAILRDARLRALLLWRTGSRP